ncbi:hypothetical protein M595_1219 [Lyngbya aestuarii BL J]|uniref:Uncharacterized protein n=1 Tax=Lyngbya aestuarii BL J TaxID=1348334 RepID=U7QL60_9CYAN|nr:hypothetical protein [Lyngbya aestuarii]ERT08699.1 hypothetical protein M595_1219 [Lyngbya aestuarii BL J]
MNNSEQKWAELGQLMRDLGLSIDDVMFTLKKHYTNDETMDFWRANHDLLDGVEQWNFDYSDMGYRDELPRC